eukprot:1192900-Prorocentrum_minimum.AAC.1
MYNARAHHVEEDGHVHLLPRLQALLFEAEALDLVKVRSRLHGGDVIGAHARDGRVAKVLRAEKGEHRLPRHAPHLRGQPFYRHDTPL